MMRGIKGKIAIVTGGTRGIGKGIAKRFLEEGATVIIVGGKNKNDADTAVAELSPLGPIEAMMVDLSEGTAVEKMVEDVVAKYGRIDILVNNAGINIRRWATEFPIEDFEKVINVNMKAYYLASRTAARYMKEQGGGSIVCISSGNSQCYTSQRSAYNISKTAVNGLVATLGVEWARFGIRINAVAPGYVMTEMIEKGIAEGIIDIDAIMSVTPHKRLLQAEEIASAVAFLASDEASGVVGQTLFVDGGWSKAGIPEPKDMQSV